jgi:hypothetical protein
MKTRRFLPDFIGAALPAALALAALASATGCATLSAAKARHTRTPDYAPANHAGDKVLPQGIRRVVLLPVSGGSIASAECTAMLDLVAAAALQQQNRFEVVPMTREDCELHFHQGDVSSVSALPQNLMAVIRRDYNADAVMLVDVTVYSAYQPLALGLRAKLAMSDDAHLVWTFDNVFSADNASVAASATRYLQQREAAGLPPSLDQVTLESPTRFATYAAAAMFSTLPPVKAPEKATGEAKAGRDEAMKR